MTKCLIKPYGFLGDIFFASSVPRKLKEEGQHEVVDMVVGLPQAEPFLTRNPWIDNVIVTAQPTIAPLFRVHLSGWDRVFQLSEVNKTVPPPMQFQMECGVRNPDTGYEIYTNPDIDKQAAEKYPEPYIAVMEPTSWRAKAFGFTKVEYEKGVNVPYYGYGGRLRDILWVLHHLGKDFNLVQVGLAKDVNSVMAAQGDQWKSMVWTASVLKNADYFIGSEGGLANVAAGVGTKTVLTSDFVHQLYGWNGVIKKVPEPKLGPRYYFPEAGHIDFSPYLTDQQLLHEYRAVLSGEKTAKDYPCDWITT
jgi:hypothetical protein